ncbi:MAG: FAD-dependent oxidoreductase, partial [Erysipelotrichaceae bacterium]|nr:FAD-dependent oxidoreductase [Erysipelotrichaceae bacterium]
MAYLNNLFSPLRVRNVILKNRIVVAPMGIPKAKLISTDYLGGLSLSDKALGGSAVITVATDALARLADEKSAFDKYALDVTREVYSIMKQGGGLTMAEIPFHGGMNEDGSFQGPSDGTHFTGGQMKEMTREQMDKTIGDMCDQALKIKSFGFDLLMLHMGHDSLCSIFLSPVWNKRTDGYGGSVENRARFMIEALKKLRETLGNDYPIMVRFSRELKVPETYEEDDMLYLLKQVEDYIDIANISCGMDCYGGTVEKYVANTYTHTTIFQPRMFNLDFAERVKKETKLKVCLVGGVSDPVLCDELIGNGSIDMVMLGRQLVADPFWPKKAQEEKFDEIIPCLRCLNCYHVATKHFNTQCSVNPRFRRENRVPLKLEKAGDPKKVVIIGGGPAGMKAALTADEAGHRVTLIEKEGKLGGNLKYADYGDYKQDLKKYRDYLIKHIERSDIDVRLNTAADMKLLESLDPDKVIIAIGADF